MKKASIIFVFIFFVSSVLYPQKQLPESVQKQIQAYEINAIKSRNAGNESAAASYYNKMAFLYWEYFIYEGAISNFNEVLTISKLTGNNNGQLKVLQNIAFVYSDMEMYPKSIEYFKQSFEFIKSKGNKEELAGYYGNMASALNNNGQSQEAIKEAEAGLQISKELNNMKLVRKFYGILYEAYEKLGNKDKSVEYFGLYSSIDKMLLMTSVNQTVTKLENEKNVAIEEKNQKTRELRITQDSLKLAEIEKKKKQMEIELLNQQSKIDELTLQQKDAELSKKKRTILLMLLLFSLLAVFASYAYQQMKARKKANKKLQELNKEITKKNNQIIDSINYASRIQESILPVEANLKKQIPDMFIFYKPRDIVSGDFYWSASHGNKVFIAAIDCTGHGVPGAFMSMIGNTLLNQVVNENKVYDPQEVLLAFNEKTVDTLKQYDKGESQGFSEDGMDVTFLCYDKKEKIVEIALAGHTSLYFKNGKRYTIEGNIFSVGGNVGLDGIYYEKHTIKIDSPTTVYMYSDGFQDQFGGINKQKYFSSRFHDFIAKNHEKPMDKQRDIIQNEFNYWKGEHRQLDDILVIGIRFDV